MSRVAIVSAKRTAIGSFGGSLKDIPAITLGVEVVKIIRGNKSKPCPCR